MLTIKEQFIHIEKIKKNIFTIFVAPIISINEAMEFIEQNRDNSATHNCWAYSVNGEYRFTDDGEPSSTAGKPIYSSILYSKLDNIVVLVVRESSGVKLGTGGLIRAYGGFTKNAIELAEVVEFKDIETVNFETSFDLIGKIYHIANEFSAIKECEEFKENGVIFSFSIEKNLEKEFLDKITNISKGEITSFTQQ